MVKASLVKLPSYKCHWTSLMISQHWFRWWLGAVRQQAITWANVDLVPCRHMASPGHNELIYVLYTYIQTDMLSSNLYELYQSRKKSLCYKEKHSFWKSPWILLCPRKRQPHIFLVRVSYRVSFVNFYKRKLGVVSISRCRLTSLRFPMLKIRLSHDRLIFNMGISIPGKDGFYIEMGSRSTYKGTSLQ